MFFFKTKKVVIDAFISERYSHAYDYAPIDYAEKFMPDWWKKLPKTELDFDIMNRKNESMKTCAGFIDHMNKGLIIPLWSDLMIKTDVPDLYSYQFSDGLSKCESHATKQRAGFQDERINIKVISPWLIRSEKNVNFTFLPAFWNHEVPPGFDLAIGTSNFYYQNATHMNLLVDIGKRIFVPFGKPMLHLMPLTERKIELRKHLVTEEQWHRENKRMISMSFNSAYFKLKKHREKMETENASKCPFSGMFK
jgi:hypothetical protein